MGLGFSFGLMAAVQRIDDGGGIFGFEQGTTGHQPVGPRGGALWAGLGVDAAVHFQQGVQAAAVTLGTGGR